MEKMPKVPNRCTCGKYPRLGIRQKKNGPRYEWSCVCGSNVFSYSEEGALDLWNDIMKKRPIVSMISRGRFLHEPRIFTDENKAVWPWVEDPDGAKAIVDHQELQDAIFFADVCEASLQRESESAGIVFQHAKALEVVKEQADDIALWQGNDLHKVRAALRFLHMAVEGGLKNPLFDLLRGKQ